MAPRAKTLAKVTGGGLPQIEVQKMAKALRYLGDKELSKEMRLATKEAITVIKDGIVAEAPVDRGVLKASRKRLSGAVRVRSTRTIGRVVITSSYAWFVERGHLTRNQRSHVPGRHYIRTGVSKSMSRAMFFYFDGQTKVAEKFNLKHAGKRRPDYFYDKKAGKMQKRFVNTENINLRMIR